MLANIKGLRELLAEAEGAEKTIYEKAIALELKALDTVNGEEEEEIKAKQEETEADDMIVPVSDVESGSS